MKQPRSLEILLAETTMSNCMTKLMYCEPSERKLLLSILREAQNDLDELNDRESTPPPQHGDEPASRHIWF